MSVSVAVERTKNVLARGENSRDPMRWAHDVCTASRAVHVGVWRFCPEQMYVEEKVLPLLHSAHEKLHSLLKGNDLTAADKEKVATYATNVELRMRNISGNYLKGKPSAFIPEDKLSEPLRKAM
jgi:hypothetical protein